MPVHSLGALQIEEVNREVITSGQEVETCNNQVTELRRQLQALEIDLQAQLSQVGGVLLHSSAGARFCFAGRLCG